MIAVGRFGIGRDKGSGRLRRSLHQRRTWRLAVPGGYMKCWTLADFYVLRMPNHDGVRFVRWERAIKR